MTPTNSLTVKIAEATAKHGLNLKISDADGNNPCLCGQGVEDWDWHWAEIALAVLADAGMVVVSAEDLRAVVKILEAVNDQWAHFPVEEPELEARLRAALPERTTDGTL